MLAIITERVPFTAGLSLIGITWHRHGIQQRQDGGADVRRQE